MDTQIGPITRKQIEERWLSMVLVPQSAEVPCDAVTWLALLHGLEVLEVSTGAALTILSRGKSRRKGKHVCH